MDSKKLKEIFLTELSNEAVDKLTPPFMALIDEAIESVIDGSTTIDGKKAITETDAIIYIRHGVLARAKLLHELILGTKTIDSDHLIINYRGTSLKVK